MNAPAASASQASARPSIAPGNLTLGVVIPALNEESAIAGAVESAWEAGALDVVVADGGSTDGTRSIAESAGARIVLAPRGRPHQMNAGADALDTDVLLFLHADARLPVDAARVIRAFLTDPDAAGGAFRMRIDAPGFYFRFISTLAHARAYWWDITLGDQGIFVRRPVFHRIGGFAPLPLLEDIDIVSRIRRHGRFRVLRQEVRSSPRRWQKKGRFKTSVINWIILFLYKAGASPGRLARLYR